MSGPAPDAGTAPWLRPGPGPGRLARSNFAKGGGKIPSARQPVSPVPPFVQEEGSSTQVALQVAKRPSRTYSIMATLADVALSEHCLQLADILDALAVQGDDHITGPDPGFAGRARGDDRDHLHAT